MLFTISENIEPLGKKVQEVFRGKLSETRFQREVGLSWAGLQPHSGVEQHLVHQGEGSRWVPPPAAFSLP